MRETTLASVVSKARRERRRHSFPSLTEIILRYRHASARFKQSSILLYQVLALDRRVTELSGFPFAYPVSSQTYSRKVDVDVLAPLASFGATAHKIASDIRLLAHLKVQCPPVKEKKKRRYCSEFFNARKLRNPSKKIR